MANKQIKMRKVKKIFKLFTKSLSKRKISFQTWISPNTKFRSLTIYSNPKIDIGISILISFTSSNIEKKRK